ncbi:PR-1-like protein [Neocallimastix californiae]|uniref:PR-1-like protein n=1 Tax=Neocallimastix californiae TaxID=1754190 RepID=A0A1Y2B9W9_9FUNG|nr:PR-1-like protein [Neocallimastix californiae]|eukprot:ORY30885.1 PR-1-like protein [Neocallimastix californiae]
MKFIFFVLLSIFALISTANGAVVKRSGLTNNEKNTLLKLHTTTRKAVKASNMKNIVWDNNIAKEAQAYASKCVYNGIKFVHASNRNGHGENLAWGTYDDVSRYYKLWDKERSDFEKAGVRTKFKGGSYGHYSQIVWADNTKIGCGYQYCSNASRYLLVCRYLTGNIIDKTVYKL